MNRLLLDTCAAIWTVEGEPLSKAAENAIRSSIDAGLAIMVSPITAWEVGLLTAKG